MATASFAGMSKSIVIRRAVYPDDAAQLMELWLALYTWVTDPEAEWESMRQWFSRTDAATFVALDPDNSDTLIGYADVGERSTVEGAEGAAAYLEAWYVKEPWRRQGIGETLIRACADWARAQGYREMGSDALLDNTLSQRLHKKFGFEEMERVVLFRMRLLSAIVVMFTLPACVDNRFMRVGPDETRAGIPEHQQVGDSIHLVAREWKHQLLGAEEPAVPSSDDKPESYEWSSSNPQVAFVRASGWMIAKAIGVAVIGVRGPGSSYSQRVSVCSRDTYLQLLPEDPIIDLHDTITVAFSLRQPSGEECGKMEFGPFAPQQGQGGLEPIFSQPNRWRAIRAGTYWYTTYEVFAKRTLRDSIFVTVR
jgi:aminoglycoside 6'-N-acetyltransferase I